MSRNGDVNGRSEFVGMEFYQQEDDRRVDIVTVRSEDKEYAPGTLAVVGGKLEENEDRIEGIVREMEEEIKLSPEQACIETYSSFEVDGKTAYPHAYEISEEEFQTMEPNNYELAKIVKIPTEELCEAARKGERIVVEGGEALDFKPMTQAFYKGRFLKIFYEDRKSVV